jgi:3-hydroxy acid dehydrogenase/malonic semialdehyde reductase
MTMITFVTGATSGFGAAIARRFAAEGHRVVAAGRRHARLNALVEELDRHRIYPLVLDVRDRRAVEASVADIPDDLKDIDLLVNNAYVADSR